MGSDRKWRIFRGVNCDSQLCMTTGSPQSRSSATCLPKDSIFVGVDHVDFQLSNRVLFTFKNGIDLKRV